jgi:hypothetical protein
MRTIRIALKHNGYRPHPAVLQAQQWDRNRMLLSREQLPDASTTART